MDNSTDGVTLLTGFVFDILSEYESTRRLCMPAFEMAAGLDPAKLDAWCDIAIYNDVCDWIEKNVGAASIRNAGRAIGNRAYDNIVKHGKLVNPGPRAIMDALKWAASTMIRDPKGRGWEVIEDAGKRVLMRRTQSFNCILQEGLLLSLLERTRVLMPGVTHVTCTRNGDPYCEYALTWLQGSRK
jgi:hypothetical protein